MSKKRSFSLSVLITLVSLLSLTICVIAFLVIQPLIVMRYAPKEGVWETHDGSAYLNFDLDFAVFGQVTVESETFLVRFWCYPKTPLASFNVVDDFSEESAIVKSGQLFANLDMTFEKDSFTAKVTESDFMEVGTELTFYKVEQK